MLAISDRDTYILNIETSNLIEVHMVAQQINEGESVTLHGYLGSVVNNVTVILDRWDLEFSDIEEVAFKHIFNVFNYTESEPDDFTLVFGFTVTSDIGPVAISFQHLNLPDLARYELIVAGACLVGLYILIIFELMHRTVAAMIAAFAGLGSLSQFHERPTFELVVSWIDFDTLGLLFGMMIMVGIFAHTGFFEWIAVKAYKLSKGNLWRLTTILCVLTAVISAFLDNVTTILLFTPVTIKLCTVLDIEPEIILLAEVMFSNIGGTATIIGDPPNIIIANHPQVKEVISFFDFSIHMIGGVLLSAVAVYFYLMKMYSHKLVRDPHTGLKHEISVWKQTLAKTSRLEEENEPLIRYLEEHIEKLEHNLETKSGFVPVSELEAKYRIKDMPLFVNSCIVLGCVVVLFFMHSFVHVIDISLAWIAIIGAMIHIVISGINNVEEILETVEWGTLMFFAALFVLMKTLEEMGLIEWIGNGTMELIGLVDEGTGRILIASLLIIWISAFTSAFIDNIPYTATLVPVIVKIANGGLGVPLSVLVWALSFGACLGGNGTLIGASANVVAVGLAEGEGFKISFMKFMKMGLPVMVISVFVASVYHTIFHVLLGWTVNGL
eukprot:TRINITY_DN1425_c0_g2_i1.p1 TRINITY_DN1425_c0_g2~~TRINITY_DN1425_c0_g2_i1.p1  ORF type:complete len:682 (-),score=128.35 TRINITY_DN1425_c0_g2_i1:5-1834(-)